MLENGIKSEPEKLACVREDSRDRESKASSHSVAGLRQGRNWREEGEKLATGREFHRANFRLGSAQKEREKSLSEKKSGNAQTLLGKNEAGRDAKLHAERDSKEGL